MSWPDLGSVARTDGWHMMAAVIDVSQQLEMAIIASSGSVDDAVRRLRINQTPLIRLVLAALQEHL